MLKVIIADDERNICRLIEKLVPWEEKGMEVVAIANNSVETYQYIEDLNPDIVITDIRMPGYDGIELINKTRSMGMDIDFIIISGYKYFEYAHRALHLGVEHYLLKPIDKQELLESLDKIIEKKQQLTEKEVEEAMLKENLQNNQKKLKEHFLTSIIQNYKHKKVIEEDELKEYEVNFRENCFQAILVKVDEVSRNAEGIGSLLKILDSIIDKRLSKENLEFINSKINSGVITVINFSPDQETRMQKIYSELLKQFRESLDKFNSFSVTVGVGKIVYHISQSAESISAAVDAVRCRLKLGVDRLIVFDELKYQPVNIQQIVDETMARRIQNSVEALDGRAVAEIQGDCINAIRAVAFYSPIALYEMQERFMEIFLETIARNGFGEEELAKVRTRLENAIDLNYGEEELLHSFRSIIVDVIEQMTMEKKSKSQLPIRMAKQYIQENYARQISLDDVGQAIHLSSAYLSTMFKKEIGINFSDYLISCRVEAAKGLLKDPELSIAQVAEQVGYTDARYFSKIFNKVVGLKPSVYRKLYS